MSPLLTFLSQHMAQVVVDGLWQGALISITVTLVLWVLPGIQAAQRFLVWSAAFALAVVMPMIPASARAIPFSSPRLSVGEGWGVALALVWMTLVSVRVVRLALQALQVRSIWRSAVPVCAEPRVLAVLDACPRRPQLCTSTDVDAPSVIGFLSPRLLIPFSIMAELTEAELLPIVLHECEHLRRYDDWLNLLQKVAVALFPLNPALSWVDQRLGLERELACDASVVAYTGAALDYARCLTRLAEHRLGRHRVVLALSAWARRSELARRVYTLLQPVRRISRVGSAGAIAATACALLATADGIVHVPTLVAFSSSAPFAASVAEPLAPVIPVVFHATGQRSEATYIPALARVTARLTARPALRIQTSQRRSARHSEQAPRFLSTSTPYAGTPAYLVPVRFSYSYAAVPFGDGWLIVQL